MRQLLRAIFLSAIVLTAMRVDAAWIHDAILGGKRDEVKRLVEKDPKIVDAAEENSLLPLHHVIEGNDIGIVKLPAAAIGAVNSKSDNGQTPLHGAAWNGHLSSCRVFDIK